MQTFGDQLKQFAQTVDIVPDEVYHDLLALVENHLKQHLRASFFAVVIEKVVQAQAWLYGEWPDTPWWDHHLKNDQGKYSCQAALAYATGRNMWIVSKSRSELHRADCYEDLLKNVQADDIPPYARVNEVESRTSIMVPLRTDVEHFGVMNIELSNYLEPAGPWLLELGKVADAIAILHCLKDAHNLQTKSTAEAKRRLERSEFVPVILHRQLFLASSSTADDEVVGVIKEVLDEWRGIFELIHWTEPAPGSVHEKIWERLSTCAFGACYFSEPVAITNGHHYRDNPNVLFEAGILYALRRIKRGPLGSLLLVREGDSAEIPFDLHPEHRLTVPRVKGGQLNKEALRSQLRANVKAMLEDG